MRLEQALEESRVHIDAFKDAAEQIEDVIKAMRPIIPMKFERVRDRGEGIRPTSRRGSTGCSRATGYRRRNGRKDGSLIVVIEMPAGMQGEFYERLNRLTAGSAETKIMK